MAKKIKYEKVREIVKADENGNRVVTKLTGNTGGYTAETTPALAVVGNENRVNNKQTIKANTVKTTKQEQLENFDNDMRTVDTVNQYKQTKKDLKEAEKKLDEKTKARQKKEKKIYDKVGQEFTAKFTNPQNEKISYLSKNNQRTALPEQKITREEVNKQVSKELEEEEKAYNDYKIANYLNNVAKVNNEETNLWDKTGGNVVRAVKDLVSPLTTGDESIITDKKGNKTFLPSYNDLKQQKVQQSYGNNLVGNLAKIGGDIAYQGTKVLGAGAIDLATGGLGGKALYWTDMANDNYRNIKNQGYSNKEAIVNTIVSTGTEFLTEKVLGGLAKPLTGGKASILQNKISKVMDNVVKSPDVSKVIGSMGSEALEEFTQTWIGALNDKVTLGQDSNIEDLVKDSLYSALVGAGTAGLSTGANVNANSLVNSTMDKFQNTNQTANVPINQNVENNKNIVKNEEINPNIAEKSQKTEINYQNEQNNQQPIQQNVTQPKQQTLENDILQNLDNTETQKEKIKTIPTQQENLAEEKAKETVLKAEAPKKEKNNQTDKLEEIKKEVEEKTGKTMSKHIETSSKATGTVGDIENMDYDTIVYDATTNKKSKEQAIRELEGKDTDTNVNDIHAKFRGTERLTDVDSAKITELMKQTKTLADEAVKSGNESEYNKRMEQFRTLKGDYAVALSESGQFVQYAKVIKELDPETQIDVLNKVIEREKRRGNKKYEDVTLNKNLLEKYKKAKTDEERDTIMEEIKDDTARQIKITLVDKANEFRFLSMLGNLKTHARNLFGNAGMYSLQSFKDGVAAIGEDIYNKASKNGLETRSKTLKPATKEVNKFVNDKVDLFMKDQTNKYNESRGMKGDLEGRTKKFNDNNIIGKALNKASNLNNKALNLSDSYFSSKMTKQAMKGFLTANGIKTNADIEAHPEMIAQALDYALFKGKEATFHQDSTTATAIRNFRDKLYTGSGFSKLGGLAIDTTLPFVSTPANIAKTSLEYTPIIGFGNINKQFQNAPDNMKANVFIDSLSKQFTGGALMAVGAYLASQGLVKGSGDDDKEDKTEASLGNASYSIKLGNSTYDLSWLSPTAIPFFEGVEVFNAFKKANSKGGIKATDTADLIDTMFGTLNPMTDMSVLQSIERVITSITYGGNAVKSATSTTFSSYLQQYIPTLLSQIAQVGDTKQRNTNTGGNVIDKTVDQIKYKIPGARNTLPEKVDIWGNPNKTASNIWQRGFEAFLSPANRKDYKVDKTTKELERLARETDDTAMLPTVKNKSLTINKKDYDLKGKDYVDLQKTYGKTAKKNLDELIKSDAYKNANDIEKQSMVRKLYDYASYKAKENYAKNKKINFDSGNQTSYAMIDAFNIPYEKYVENKVSGNEGASKMLNKLNRAGFSEAQKGAVMNYFDRAYYVNEDDLYSTLENSNLSNKQKELIKEKYKENITDSERERYQRADNIGIDYDLYTNFRSFVANARGESRTGGLTKKQKVINWIQEQQLTAKQKQNLYNDYINNQGIFSYYK